MNFKYSISLDIPYDVYEYIENNHGKLSYSEFIEKNNPWTYELTG